MSNVERREPADDPALGLVADFSQAARALFAAADAEDTLPHVVSLAVASIEGCDFAGVFVAEEGSVTTRAETDPVVVALDRHQRLGGEGPSLDALVDGITFYAEDLSRDPRWPHFGPASAARGVRSLLALPLSESSTLNLYGRYPQAFGVIDRARGQLLAVLAGLAFASIHTHEDQDRLVANLHDALATRGVIGQAQGILIERERITAAQAFEVLRRASQHLNVKLREVAQNLVDTGEKPDTGPPPPMGRRRE